MLSMPFSAHSRRLSGLLVAAATSLVLAITLGPPAIAVDNPTSYRDFQISATADNRLRVDLVSTVWRRGERPARYRITTAANRGMFTDVRQYVVPFGHEAAIVPHASTSTPASGNPTYVQVIPEGGVPGGTVPRPNDPVVEPAPERTIGKTSAGNVKWLRPVPPAPPATGPRVSIGAFNVLTWKAPATGQAVWNKRRNRVVRQIVRSGAGIIALQEAGGPPTKRFAGKRWQYEDLARRLPKRYKLADARHFKNSRTRQGIRIVYDAKRYRPLRRGLVRMPHNKKRLRFAMPWTTFRDRASGAEFSVISAHLTPGRTSAIYRARAKQANKLVKASRRLARTGRSVIVAGDLNSTANTRPQNLVHNTLINAGFYDAAATRALRNGDFTTTNGGPGKFRTNDSWPFRYDYILTLGGPAGSYSFTNHIYTQAKQFQSDHFMQSAVVPVNPGPY